MSELILLLIGAILVNNFVLVQFLGLCPFMGTSRKIETAIGMAAASTFVLTLSAMLSYLIYHYLLIPLGIPWLRTIAFIVLIAAIVNLTEIIMSATSSLLHRVLGIFLPLITSNCAVLGVALLNINQARSFIEATVFGFGAALGFSLVLILFAALRERLDHADVPEPFRGPAIAMISAGLMSLAFMGFTGLVQV
jgi:electron transport complex protein RnfA